MASTVLTRWTAKLRIRRQLLDRAERSVRYWAARAGSTRGKQMLMQAVARRALRRIQVIEAERVVARHSKVTRVSDRGVSFVASFEGFRAKPYRDVGGVWTIGYGDTRGVTASTPPWTRAYALRRLRDRLNEDYLAPVLAVAADDVGLNLKQHQADALASLVYNLGPGVLESHTTMGSALRSGDRARIADAMLLYDKARVNGKIVRLEGLTRRRKAERALFLHG